MACEIAWEPNGVHRRLWGTVSAGEFLETIEAVQRDPRFLRVRYVINDFSAVTGHGLTDEIMGELAARKYGAHAVNPRCRVLFVTQDDKLARLINRYLMEARRVSYHVEVARNLEQARLWLDTRPASFRLPLNDGRECQPS